MASFVLTLEQLPDDVLVLAMQLLSVEDILACRLVCKRLCGLALHPDVWLHRSLKDDEPRADAVLHLAPCLEKLTVTGRVPTLAVTTTRCAVASLELKKNSYREFRNAAEYAFAVRNQEFLGRLKKLELDIYGEANADVLYRTVASCSGLDSLTVVFGPQTTHPVVHGPPSSSLTIFRCGVSANSTSFVNTILAGHAATLEKVEINNARIEQFDVGETTTADLLAAMPRLRSLLCDSTFCGFEEVAACKTLRDVTIELWICSGDFGSVAKFLRRAKQLQRVRLENGTGVSIGEHGAALVDALVSSGWSHVERLALYELEDAQPLLRALPSLPALRHLDLVNADTEDEDERGLFYEFEAFEDARPFLYALPPLPTLRHLDGVDVLLKSITPVTAPALRLLEIEVVSVKCPHAWIHRAAVKAALMANPLLHIQLWCYPTRRPAPQECEVCERDCHQGVKWHEVKKIGLYSHDPEECPSPEDLTPTNDDNNWRRSLFERPNVACTWIHM
ncbi:uncharacterized protein LOC113203764 [Frankliniella occidentalis]|uniref:Uncharacterized protein LOC113203764 n=1 Tax=Frankliniella occidentalis TaxID=133901 RepID=A0A6J1RZQ8_FRAOC|nr:uncharacterized protein LOC113203764 [Frankliniella occidentalis]